jgi:hypothetical protein
MKDSSMKNLAEVEYDKHNLLQHRRTQVWRENSKRGLPSVVHNINRCIARNFPIETLLKRIDYIVRSLGKWNKISKISYNIKKSMLKMLKTILIVIFDFPKASHTMIHHFQKYFN